ncbi:tetratricopeptide repeat protein [Pseudodesulfovibrio methanolicus]|uniref:Tetratricopeptide repeat protein n=1 Tax=Pseudodesulfovibrio methanolicus TaxID=3126690 RepID=A0ABZ2IUK7_9BACT
MKKFIALLLLLSVLSAAAGCAKVLGPYYLEQEQYEEGIKVMGEQLKENPDDAASAYYVGRYYLALNEPKQGLPYLQKAVRLSPEDADYVFWTGVAYWAMMDFDRERAAYEKAISLDPNHISAHLYLGHGYADRGQWAQALKQYDVVLKLDPYNPEALYNRARALRGLDKTSDEIAAWKRFLEYYPDGSMAMTATEQLNLHGDFTYRNFIIGKRNVTLLSMAFKPGTSVLDADGWASLEVLSALMQVNKGLVVDIVAYVKGNAPLAKARAAAIRDYMLNAHPDVDRSRLPLSWFGTAENVQVGDKTFALDQSVSFITEVR